jgi:hypothetical protein
MLRGPLRDDIDNWVHDIFSQTYFITFEPFVYPTVIENVHIKL